MQQKEECKFGKPLFSALIPSFNSEATLQAVIESIENQKTKPSEIIVIDDCSSDQSKEIVVSKGCRLYSLEKNSGRGKVRNKGTTESKSPFLLFCDSSNVIDSSFSDKALRHFHDPMVAAVFGRIKNSPNCTGAISRWRGRHLFKEYAQYDNEPHEVSTLITYAIMLRREAVMAVGNFNPKLRQCEDQELGSRLLKHGYRILADNSLCAYSIKKESLSSLFLRYDRWYSKPEENHYKIRQFWTNLKCSLLFYAREDIRCGDFLCAVISLLMPFWLLCSKTISKGKLS
jgi:glycosyltransferase involved in cell wall biosynthesis